MPRTPQSTSSKVTPTRERGEMEIGLAVSGTELMVGEVVTFTITVTNTGQLRLDKMSCNPKFDLENGTGHSTSVSSILEEVLVSTTYSFSGVSPSKEFKVTLGSGQSNKGVITLRAIKSGTTKVRIGCAALAQARTTSEQWTGQEYQPVTIRILPSSQ